jgi:probable HAF family extracellular repeat protein
MQRIGALPGDSVSVAYGVSEDGSVVVGTSGIMGSERAFRWTKNEGMQELSGLESRRSEAHDVSADGSVVVGWFYNDEGHYRAFRWANGVVEELGTLGGQQSLARAVSANGRFVVGTARNSLGQFQAFLWTPEQGMRPLGALGNSWSDASAVSADGSVVVGWSPNAFGWVRAFRWTPQRGMEDLNRVYANLLSEGSYLEVAYGVSPDGRYIVGHGYDAATGRFGAYLLDTVPEPASLMALGAWLAGLALRCRRLKGE